MSPNPAESARTKSTVWFVPSPTTISLRPSRSPKRNRCDTASYASPPSVKRCVENREPSGSGGAGGVVGDGLGDGAGIGARIGAGAGLGAVIGAGIGVGIGVGIGAGVGAGIRAGTGAGIGAELLIAEEAVGGEGG